MSSYLVVDNDTGRVVNALNWDGLEVSPDKIDIATNESLISLDYFDDDKFYLDYIYSFETDTLIYDKIEEEEQSLDNVITVEKVLAMSEQIVEMQKYLIEKELSDLIGGLIEDSEGGEV